MSIMTENKARRILKDYMEAELKGDDAKAILLENKLNEAGWKISVGAEGYTVIRENGGLFESDTTNMDSTFFSKPPHQSLPPRTNESTINWPMIIGISIGGLILVIAVILGIRAIKRSQNVASG